MDEAQIHVAVMLAADIPNPTLFPAVIYPSAFSFFFRMRVEIQYVPPYKRTNNQTIVSVLNWKSPSTHSSSISSFHHGRVFVRQRIADLQRPDTHSFHLRDFWRSSMARLGNPSALPYCMIFSHLQAHS